MADVSLRSGWAIPSDLAAGYPLYDPRLEHDACGVGFVAQVDGKRSHELVEQAILSVVNVTHRGAVAADGKSGDGAGILSQIPERLFERELKRLKLELPSGWKLSVGMIFLPQEASRRDRCVALLEEAVERAGFRVLGWRQVPVQPDALGERARATMPDIQQLLVASPPAVPAEEVERRLYVARKEAETAAAREAIDDFYVPSFSCRTVVYKGLFVAPQMAEFYPDLHEKDFEAAIVVFHQRYSTNTFPTWFLAQPFRMLAHNGEINTLWGNRNWMRAREADLKAEVWGSRIESLKPVIEEAGSDSAQLDNVLELLVRSERSPAHAMMMMVPEAWENMPDMDPEVRAFYQYHALLMEPWDGPASLVFSDGIVAGACLDRNGLRPARYKVTEDGLVVVASEVGVVELNDAKVIEKGRLAPGEMLLVDTAEKKLYRNAEIKHRMASQNPYGHWLRRKLVELPSSGFSISMNHNGVSDLLPLQRAFGYTNEDLLLVLQPMGAEGHDAVWSMGDDTPLTVLSKQRRAFYSYFKQRFAQVTNPPIDPLREELVMSLGTYGGPRRSLLEETEDHAAVIELPTPVLMEGALERLRHLPEPHLQAQVIKCHFAASLGPQGLEPAIERICQEAAAAATAGKGLLILSDRGVDEHWAPIPMLLATSAIHHHLVREGLRNRCDLIVESGDVWDIHHFACLIGYGASAVDPYLAFETVRGFCGQRGMETLDPQESMDNYRAAVEAGLLKIMSKMGISTLSSYRGAQIFEAIGLRNDVVEQYFAGTPSRIDGVGLEDVAADVLRNHQDAFGERTGPTGKRGLRDTGYIRFRGDGEYHGYNPFVVRAMHKASLEGDYDAYREFVALQAKHEPAELRDLIGFKQLGTGSVPLSEVEPVESIVRHFYTTAMSLGALSPEAVQTLAIGMNMLGARSNSGEGGEDPDWYVHPRNGVQAHNKIKQVASARFGVTSYYLSNAEELEIKMAQGSKPGEGGQLPKHKVNAYIAHLRHAIPGIPLISPPPHHDIYSIEDLAQLIYDLKQANPIARVGVKLVSEAGVGTIAAGVAKAYADYILVSGDSGGTGASPLSSIKNAGCPWELGLAETQQVLVLNDLRGRVRLRTDGGLKTGRDVIIAAMLGAEEFGFGTSAVVALGCDMARQCHLNTCPTGVATQREDLRAKFAGTPEMVVNYFTLLATEVREIMAGLGIRCLDEIIGRADLLEQTDQLEGRGAMLDLSALLKLPDPTMSLPHKRVQERNDPPVADPFHEKLANDAAAAWKSGKRVSLAYPISNANRAVGARLAYEISKRHGGAGLADGTLQVSLTGSAGQSFGAFLTRGIRLTLEGEANDYVGKGMGGGEIVVVPPKDAQFVASENIIMGNTVLYGATGGRLFAAGRAGERFAVRNSGATAVIEGAGDHCCEYMTGGIVVVLGPVGRNFAAGMSAGTAYVLDEDGSFPGRVNSELVDIERIAEHGRVVRLDDEAELRSLVEEHLAVTGSARAREILDGWSDHLPRFWKVIPDPPAVQTQTAAMVGADSGTQP